jgi:hypothetical protein
MLAGGASGEEPVVIDSAESSFNGSAPNQGWWAASVPNVATNATYLTGTHWQVTRRGFFSFDLSGLAGRVESVRLEVNRGRANSTDASEVLEIFDVSTGAAALNAGGADPAIFEDLGSGRSYGRFEVSTGGSPGDVLGFDLGPAAAEDAEAALGGWFSVGLSLASDDGDDNLFAVTATSPVHRLVVVLAPSIPVEIDVRPGSGSSVVVPPNGSAPVDVAIHGTADFDPSTVFVNSLRFGPGGAVVDGTARLRDVNGDGADDLVVRFLARDSGLGSGMVEACIVGETLDGTAVEGCDQIEVRHPDPPGRAGA